MSKKARIKSNKENQKLDLLRFRVENLRKRVASESLGIYESYFAQFTGEELTSRNWRIPQMQHRAQLVILEAELKAAGG